jgi:hypothetical protein
MNVITKEVLSLRMKSDGIQNDERDHILSDAYVASHLDRGCRRNNTAERE